ncbi:MAG TPA: hypothetical protein VFO25_08390 [Candidatus Eremiobacteraceae bacterium]|nr:hypothetical protein [Candidatus Eremiobacteraceae bacterium]
MFPLILAAAIAVAPPTQGVGTAVKATLHLRGTAWVGERWVQGDEAIAVRAVNGGSAVLDVQDVPSGDRSQIVVALDPYSGAGPAIFFDQTTLCVTSGIASLCSPVTGSQTFSGAVTFSAAGTAVTITNNASIGGTLQVTGTSTLGTVNAGQISSSTLTASNCVGSDGSKNLVSNTNCLQSLTAGSNLTSTGGAAPTVATTAAPSFSGTVTAGGLSNSGNTALTQSVSTNTNSSVFPPFTTFTNVAPGSTFSGSTTLTLSSGTDAGNGIVVGAVLKISDTTNTETVTVTATPAGNTFTATYANSHVSASYTFTPIVLPVTVTPASMAGITTGQLLYVDTGTSLDQVPVVSTTMTQFTGLFSKTHATGSIAITAGGTVGCTATAVGCTLYSAATGATGGWVYTAPNIQGADGNEQGIVTIVVPTNGNGANNVPYDINFEGGQNGDSGKTSHTLTFNCNAQPQDCLMFLLQGDTSGGTNQKCVSWNTGGSGSTSTPSLMILKCRGDLTILGGNFTANSNQNGQGGFLSANAAGVTGALGNGQIDIGQDGIIAADTSCSITMPNGGGSTAMVNGFACKVTTGSANTSNNFTIAYPNAYNTAPMCFVTNLSVTANLFPRAVPGTSSCVVTWFNTSGTATNPGNSQSFMVFIVGGK